MSNIYGRRIAIHLNCRAWLETGLLIHRTTFIIISLSKTKIKKRKIYLLSSRPDCKLWVCLPVPMAAGTTQLPNSSKPAGSHLITTGNMSFLTELVSYSSEDKTLDPMTGKPSLANLKNHSSFQKTLSLQHRCSIIHACISSNAVQSRLRGNSL